MTNVKTTLKNTSGGFRGIYEADGSYVELAPGQAKPVTLSKGEADDLPDYFEKVDASDGGEDLHGKKVAELKELARVEDLDLGDATSKADIIAAIELGREANATA